MLYLLQDNYTALHIAVESCKPAVVETLLGYGADVHVRGGKQRETALHIAARIPDGNYNKHENIVLYFINLIYRFNVGFPCKYQTNI